MNNRGIFWGVFLVLLGTVYLLRQMGFIYFHITWLFSWTLWPVFLIIAGLRLMLPRSGNLAGGLVLLALISVFAFVIYEGYRMKKAGNTDDWPSWMQPGHGRYMPHDDGDEGDRDSDDADSTRFNGTKLQQSPQKTAASFITLN